MTNYDDVTIRWVDRALGQTTKGPLSARGGRMYCTHSHQIYSYGSHFELGRFLFTGDQPVAVLLNGDNYSVTTSRHQSVTRNAAHRSRLPVVILPYSALESAGVKRDSIEIVHVTEDRRIETEHKFREIQPTWRWRSDGHEDHLYVSGRQGATRVTIHRDDDGTERYSYTTSRHLLGGSLIRASYDERRRAKCPTCKGVGELEEKQTDWYDDPQQYRHFTEADRHRMAHRCPTCVGNRVITRTRTKTAYFISDFDHNEPRELYFFCELPQGVRPKTLDEAIEMLKPDTVRMAEQMGRPVKRQGDIFAIELKRVTKRDLRKAGARIEKGGGLLGTNHVATEVAYMPNGQTLARGVLRHQPQWRRPDHVRVPLSAGWHVILKNTVPIA